MARLRPKFCAALVILISAITVGCGENTEPATDVTATSANLHGVFGYAKQTSGQWWFEYSSNNGASWQASPKVAWGPYTQDGSLHVVRQITGLTPNTTYVYRLCQTTPNVCADKDGKTTDPRAYESFRTAASQPSNCDVTASTSETPSALQSRTQAGQTVCLPSGTYNWNSTLTWTKPGVTLRGSGPGTVVNGTITVNASAPDVTIENFKIVGPPVANVDSGVLKPLGDRFVINRMDITSNGRSYQGIQVGGGGGSPEDGKVLNSLIHHAGAEGQHDHGVYDVNSDRTLYSGNWLYKNAAWGFHLYPDTDDAVMDNNTLVNNGQCATLSWPLPNEGGLNNCVLASDRSRGHQIAFSGEGSSHTDRSVFRNGIISTDGPGSLRDAIHCYMVGVGNRVENTRVKLGASQALTDCGSSVSLTGITQGAIAFVDAANDDYRTSTSQVRPGPQ